MGHGPAHHLSIVTATAREHRAQASHYRRWGWGKATDERDLHKFEGGWGARREAREVEGFKPLWSLKPGKTGSPTEEERKGGFSLT